MFDKKRYYAFSYGRNYEHISKMDLTLAMTAEIIEGVGDLLHGPVSLVKNVWASLGRNLMSLLANLLRLTNVFIALRKSRKSRKLIERIE
jgi:hypothetical protein